jgi:hypothetical protein
METAVTACNAVHMIFTASPCKEARSVRTDGAGLRRVVTGERAEAAVPAHQQQELGADREHYTGTHRGAVLSHLCMSLDNTMPQSLKELRCT